VGTVGRHLETTYENPWAGGAETMIRKRCGTVFKDVQTLYGSGVQGASSDAELLGRFVDRLDESAEASFAALLARHGPMVLRVCRSVLRSDQDAQDAFQATFLILVRRAASVRNRASIGSWLYGVAMRISVRARATDARRRKHETLAAASTVARSADEKRPSLELSAILHEELTRLPERYRVDCGFSWQADRWRTGQAVPDYARGHE
jgi:RNA polymerase sigma factor (sigma-70 family)